jgi:hypothetical protein
MANDISRNPMVIDTVMAVPYPHVIFIENIAWTDFGVADSLIIKDGTGGLILDTKTTAANTSNYQNFPVKGKYHGFQVTTLTAGGKVFISLK